MATTPTYPAATGHVLIGTRILPADSTDIVDVKDNSLGTRALKVDALNITTNNSADRVATIYIHDGVTSFRWGSVTVPDLAGSDGATNPRINVLGSLGVAGGDGVPCIWIPAGCKLQVGMDAAIAADKVLDVIGRAQDFS